MKALAVGLVALLVSAPAAGGDRPAGGDGATAGGGVTAAVLTRVEHHVRNAVALADHFDVVVREGCPHFATAVEWETWLDAEVDRIVSLMAHVEQAWAEARTTGDDDVRRAAKAPRRRLGESRALMDKLSACAAQHGESLPVLSLLLRVERQVPQRQAEITLPR
jgi:hypothetical protein